MYGKEREREKSDHGEGEEPGRTPMARRGVRATRHRPREGIKSLLNPQVDGTTYVTVRMTRPAFASIRIVVCWPLWSSWKYQIGTCRSSPSEISTWE